MDFSWNDEQKKLYKDTVKFAQAELNAGMIERDRDQTFNREGWDKCGQFGIMGMLAPEEYGGSELGPLTTAYVLEALGYGSKDNGLTFSINAHIWTAIMPILIFGTDEQKQKYLPKLISGEYIGGNAMTEPSAGTDAFSMKTSATLEGDHYLLKGSKTFITNAPVADLLVIYANIDPEKGQEGITAFIVETAWEGITIGKHIEKMGGRTSPFSEVFLDDCRVPVANRLGDEGAGVSAFTQSMEWERGFILASAVGTMQRIMEDTVKYARQRKQFDQAISKNQMIAHKLVGMKMRIEAARHMLYKTAWLKEQNRTALLEAAMTKLHISESWVQTCMDAIQIHGGYGYTVEYELERELRDALGSKIYSGTSEIQEHIIARFMRL